MLNGTKILDLCILKESFLKTTAKKIPSSKGDSLLQWNVSVFFLWKRFAFVFQHFEGRDQLAARFFW